MKKLSLTFAALLLVAGFALFAPLRGQAGSSNKEGQETTVTGYISDSSCGLKHMDGMGDEKSCTLMCVQGGSKLVLTDRAGKVVYQLDKTGQEKASAFAGQHVKVTGRVKGKTIQVTNIEAAS